MKRIGIVNRGEAAMRFLAAIDVLRREDPGAPEAVVLFTDGDADALFVNAAPYAAPIGRGRDAYLDADNVLAALHSTGCDAAWLGWGFASEDADFAATLEAGGITLLAPRAETMRLLGDKIAAKRLAEENEVPVAAWAVVTSAAEAREAADRIGYPVLLKAAGGGGGRGIRNADDGDEAELAFDTVVAEASRSFRSQGVFVERRIDAARHVEVQIIGDGRGGITVFGLRDCSLQRRRQKIIEECPAPNLPPARQAALEGAAERLCAAVRYRSAGTVEFLYDPIADEAWFLEVNTRLQVEHPITEMVYATDLVRWQIDLARGRSLPGERPSPRGWSFEARICAEDPRNGFAPAPGHLVRFALPTGPGIRVDTGFTEGDTLSPDFDSLIAKLIAWGPSRASALARLSKGLDETRIVLAGGQTNLEFLRGLVKREDVRAGAVAIDLVDGMDVPESPGAGIAVLAAAVDRFLESGDRASALGRHRVDVGESLSVYRVGPDVFRIVGRGGGVTVGWNADDPYQIRVTVAGRSHRVERAPGDANYIVDGVSHRVEEDSGGVVRAPSMAVVLAVLVGVGDEVGAGQTVIVLESMKMEVRVATTTGGKVREIACSPGAQVAPGQVLIEVETEGRGRTAGPALPWTTPEQGPGRAARRLSSALLGWDIEPGQFAADVAALDRHGCLRLLSLFADLAEVFERRPTRQLGGGEGAADAVTAAVALRTLRWQGPDALRPERRQQLARVLSHHGVDDLSAPIDDAILRVERAGAALDQASTAAVAALRVVDQISVRLLDRLTALDPERFSAVIEAADRVRYRLFGKPAYDRLHALAEERAASLLDRLHAGDAAWSDLAQASESLTAAMARPAADGDALAAEALARRLEWQRPEMPVVAEPVADRTGWRVGQADDEAVLVVAAYPHEAAALLTAARARSDLKRFELVLVSDGATDEVIQAVERLAGVGRNARGTLPWHELCVMVVSGPGIPRVRRYTREGAERTDRRDILPTTARRLDLGRLERFEFERLDADEEVALFLARARTNPDDVRLLAYGEVRSLRRRPGRPLHLPDVDRVFHAAVRAIQEARETHDPRRRLYWNRLTLHLLPVVPLGPKVVRRYMAKLAPLAEQIGLEKIVVRARYADAKAEGGVSAWIDLSVFNPSGHRVEFVERPASHRPIMPRTRYESRLVAARRRGLVYPYEIITMLEGGGSLPPGRFEEYDLVDGVAVSVGGRARGENVAGVVFGIMRTRLPDRLDVINRVLLLSDPTERMGALAEPECRRVIAAFDLAEVHGLPIEWVPVSAGARIDWDTGTENLDWTAQVLRRIVEFTQAGGEVNIVVPGICVGAQAYWNAEATMMMHTRGLLIMTDRGSMVLTGKRALDISGCVSAEDDLALGGYTAIMGPNGQAQAHASDLGAAYRLLYRYYGLTAAPVGQRPPFVGTVDLTDRDVCAHPYPADLDHGFATVGQVFSKAHNPDRKRPFAVRPLMAALSDRDCEPVERWAGMRDADTAVVWEARIGGHSVTLLGIDNQPVARVGRVGAGGPGELAGGTLYPQASRKVARALNAASGRRPVVVLANLSGFDGSPESLANRQLEYGAEIGRAVVNFAGPIYFIVVSRYHGGAYVVFSKQLNPDLHSVALEGSYASVIGGAPAANVVFAREVRREAAARGGGEAIRAEVVAELAAKFDGIHTVERAKDVGSIDAIISPNRLRPYLIDLLRAERASQPTGTLAPQMTPDEWAALPGTAPPDVEP